MGGGVVQGRRLVVTDALLAASGGLDQGGGPLSTADVADHELLEVDVDLGPSLAGSPALARLSMWLGHAVVAARASLRSLRLSGPLHLGAVFNAVAPFAAQFTRLEQVYLARGGDEWQPDVAVQALRLLPALQRLQIRFSFDDEHPPSDLLGTLLPRRVSLDAAAAAAAAEAGVALPLSGGALAAAPVLASLRHLALVHPPRSVIPPTAHLPDALSTMTQLTALKMKRVPTLSVPTWLGALSQLRYLLWDPALPAESEFTMPPGLHTLTNLEFLWIVHDVPLIMPTSLAPRLRGLHTMSKGFCEEKRWEQHWGWLEPFTALESIRFQGVGLTQLPAELLDKSLLTRLDLMVNELTELPEGPYLASLRCAHLGNNHLSQFPSALLKAPLLENVYLANQVTPTSTSTGTASPVGSACSVGSSRSQPQWSSFTRRLDFTQADVAGLLRLPRLHTLVMNNLQPLVLLGMQRQDFSWLQRALKQRGIRLTSNELAYGLQSKAVFDLGPLPEAEAGAEGRGADVERAHSAAGSTGGASSDGGPSPRSSMRAASSRLRQF